MESKTKNRRLVPNVGDTVIAALVAIPVSPGSLLNKVGSGLCPSWPVKMVTLEVYIVSLSDCEPLRTGPSFPIIL